MRVEACGNIEPKTGDTLLDHHRSQRFSEPISIINPKNTGNNYLSNHERRYSDLNLFEGESTITGQNTLNLTIGFEQPTSSPLPIGFFLNEEEWSFFKQPHIGLEPYERKKMTSLPKSFTPLASAFGGLGLGGRSSSVTESASDSTVSRQCESLNETPSLAKLNDEKEQNNNEFPKESEEKKLSVTNREVSANNSQVLEDAKDIQEVQAKNLENLFSHEDEAYTSPYCTTVTTSSSMPNAQANERKVSNSYLHSNHLQPNYHLQPLENEVLVDFRNYQYPYYIHHTQQGSSSVDTIDSHPVPISSSCRNQVHTPSHLSSHHQCYLSSLNSQQTELGGDSSSFFANFQHPNQVQHQNFKHLWQDKLRSYGTTTGDASTNGLHEYNGNDWFHEQYNSAAHGGGEVFHVENHLAPASQEPTTVRLPGGGRPDEMDTLLTFLSKFDDKVAAIWGQQGAAAAAMLAASFAKAGSNPNSESSTVGSNSSTPTASDLSYAWGSPTMSNKGTGNGFPSHCMIQSEQQQRALAESQRVAESFYQKQYLSLQRKDYPQGINLNPPQHKPHPQKSNINENRNRISIGSPIMSPPSGKHTIMHSLKEYFGSPPGQEDYIIFRELDVSSSIEETERSLKILNHSVETSGFVRYVPASVSTAEQDDVDVIDEACGGIERGNFYYKRGESKSVIEDSASTEVETKAMEDVLTSLELDGDEELEIVEACKVSHSAENPEELLQSWKTHFIPVATIEENSRKHGSSQSPYGTLAPHQINPNLPEYKLFGDEIPDGYKIFQYPGRTLFPIKYKLRVENHKSVQTETLSELTQSNVQQHDSYYQPYTVFDWEGFNPGNQHPYVMADRSMSPLSTLVKYDNENHLEEINGSRWNISTATGPDRNGTLLDVDYNFNHGGMDSLAVNYGRGGHPQYGHPEYCCDSGIDIDVGSRIGFYDDGVSGECDGEGNEYLSSGCGTLIDDASGLTVLQNPHAAIGFGSENDVDYGHFQGYSMYPVELSSSATSSKHGKSSRRRAKVKPCKYFFLDGSCRRGKECKFSHDLTTCRYWAEGSCLKGESCPYLHCFLDRNEYNEDQVSNTSSKQYLLESENDFPALGGLENSKQTSMGSSRVPMSVGFLPSPAFSSETDRSQFGSSFAMLADPAGCAPSIGNIGVNSYAFDELGLETFEGTTRFDGGVFNAGISGLENKFTFGLSKINNNEQTEHKGQNRHKGGVGPKQRKNKRLVEETATLGGVGSMNGPWGHPVFHNKGVSSGGGGSSNNGWNCSFVVNTKEKRKKKKH